MGIEGNHKKNSPGKVEPILYVVTVFIHVRAPSPFSPQIIFLFLDLEPLMGTKEASVIQTPGFESIPIFEYVSSYSY